MMRTPRVRVKPRGHPPPDRHAAHQDLLRWWATAAALIDRLYHTASAVARAAADPEHPVYGLIDARRAMCLAAELSNAGSAAFDAVPHPVAELPDPLANCP